MSAPLHAFLRFLLYVVLYVAPLLCLALFLYALGIPTNNNLNFLIFLPFCIAGLLCAAWLSVRAPRSVPYPAFTLAANLLAILAIVGAGYFNIMLGHSTWVERGMPEKFKTTAAHREAVDHADTPFPARPD